MFLAKVYDLYVTIYRKIKNYRNLRGFVEIQKLKYDLHSGRRLYEEKDRVLKTRAIGHNSVPGHSTSAAVLG